SAAAWFDAPRSAFAARGPLRENRQPGIGLLLPALAGRQVTVHTTGRAKTPAVFSAQGLHRQRERRLGLDQRAEIELVVRVEVRVEVVSAELQVVSGRRTGRQANVDQHIDVRRQGLETPAARQRN